MSGVNVFENILWILCDLSRCECLSNDRAARELRIKIQDLWSQVTADQQVLLSHICERMDLSPNEPCWY